MLLRWKELTLALIIALGLWYGVSGAEKIESKKIVYLEYKGVPQGLVIQDDNVDALTVTVSASARLLRTMRDRDYSYPLDLSSITKGENILPIDRNQFPFGSGVDILNVTPSQIELHADVIDTKNVPLILDVQGELPVDYQVHASVQPRAVSIKGASSRINEISSVRLAIPLSQPFTFGTSEIKKVVPMPEGTIVTPSEVIVTLQTSLKKKDIKIQRQIVLPMVQNATVWANPGKISIVLSVPESQVDNVAADPEIIASAPLTDLRPGQYSVPVHIKLPDGVDLIQVEPTAVEVSIEPATQTSSENRKKQ